MLTPVANRRLLAFILLGGNVICKCGFGNDPRPTRFKTRDFARVAHVADVAGVAFEYFRRFLGGVRPYHFLLQVSAPTKGKVQ